MCNIIFFIISGIILGRSENQSTLFEPIFLYSLVPKSVENDNKCLKSVDVVMIPDGFQLWGLILMFQNI